MSKQTVTATAWLQVFDGRKTRGVRKKEVVGWKRELCDVVVMMDKKESEIIT